MKNDLALAKEMFFYYGCSHFFMAHEGDYEKYKKFNISKEQEIQWVSEFQNNLLKAINEGKEDNESVEMKVSSLCSTLRTFKNLDIAYQLMDALNNPRLKLDSFSKMVISEIILETVRSLNRDKNLSGNIILADMKKFALNMLKSVADNPIIVDPAYLNAGYLKDEVKESSIIDRIQGTLKEWS